MTRETSIPYKIALLATGDEISHGDIANSNAQEIALRLANHGMQTRMHMVAPDSIREIEQAIQFLLDTHEALIITGGLGPTSDDLTRYALSKVLNQPLVFDEATWESICSRLKRFGYATPPENNRQQALFPKNATIIPNPHGTAAGCVVQQDGKYIFMLPGPPIECLPMVEEIVLPTLKKASFSQVLYHQKWLLFGVSEGKIAEELDALAKPYDCVTGYRLFYPYIEFKLHSNNQHDFKTLVQKTEKAISSYLIGDGQQIASELLKNKLKTLNFVVGISDSATGGLLEATIKTWQTNLQLDFSSQQPHVEIQGLNEYWQHMQSASRSTLEIIFTYKNSKNRMRTEIPFRGEHVRKYAVEFACWKIYDFISASAIS